mmetsp:Transcript_28635/g.52110  ORF Transcript_28635/g.52110 Transcript_28635/m.52110 type:complete len:488 (-) Transcript_28635:72-1535(-)
MAAVSSSLSTLVHPAFVSLDGQNCRTARAVVLRSQQDVLRERRGQPAEGPSASQSLVPACGLGLLAGVAYKSRQRGSLFPRSKQSGRRVRCSASKMEEIAESCLLNNYGTRNMVFEKGNGSYIYDSDGKEFLDFTAGIAVNCLGHSDEGWAEAVSTQAKKLTHTSNLFLTPPQVELGKKLTDATFADKAFFCNSGTEANEAAIKFARKFHFESGKPREKFVAFENAFHGRTMGALSLTWKEGYKIPFEPLMPSSEFLTFNSTEGLEKIDESTCAVFVEPVQGEGGVIPGTVEFLSALRSRCDEVGALLIFDEVQCGLGRTGHLFAYELKGVTPDLMTLAKPLAGGLPIGAVLMTDKVAAAIKPGDHGSTFAGAPLVCAAANYTVDVVSDKDFLANVEKCGAALRKGLSEMFKDLEGVDVRGEGLLCGVVFPEVDTCGALQKAAQEEGLLVLTAGKGNVLRITPPLNTNLDEVEECLAKLKKAYSSVH